MAEKLCIHCLVSGLVQGVWYRANTQKEALKLGLNGWVRNLPDGRVEVMAAGDRDRVLQLHEWLKQGPPRAKVEDVSYEELDWEEYSAFEIL